MSWEKLIRFLSDNKAMVAGLAGLVTVLVYYLALWAKVGRRPAAGAVMPIYEPPNGMSPAAMRYLERMTLDDRAFTACILDLAAKGYLGIEQDRVRIYRLLRKPKYAEAESRLTFDEKALARKLFEGGSTVYLSDENCALMGGAREALVSALHTSMERIYFVTNMRYLWPGILLTIATLAGLFFLGIGGLAAVVFMPFFLTAWTLGTYGVISTAFKTWRSAPAGGLGGRSRATFLTLFSVPMMMGEVLALVMILGLTSGFGFLVIIALLVINVLFFHLLRAPTRAGRLLLDRIEGFKLFLNAVEGQRLNALAPPGKTPQDFERLLPYAVALGVEHAWGQQFSRVVAAATGLPEPDRAFSPSWYSGPHTSSSPAAFTVSFSGEFSAAVASSASPPGSGTSAGRNQ